MNDILNENLFFRQNKQFEIIKARAKSFVANYCGNVIIRDSIFAVASNYARKMDFPLEILRYPFQDDELWACTFLKQGTTFLCVNSGLPFCKQFFAAAHELYHIYCFIEGICADTIATGSVLMENIVDNTSISQEDLEANAFAGLLLMPDNLLNEQIEVYGIEKGKIDLEDVLLLMDLFATPYKATVLRLFECGIISKHKAKSLVEIDTETIQKRMEILGKASQWQMSNDLVYFGTLIDNFDFNISEGFLTEEREKSDRKLIDDIKNSFNKKD